ncbi:MAG: hypothetical protein DRN14_02465 [Thermoplasmata archaeon]|nr:DUF2240 family protein [Thermoplasmata archaeon]RLF29297.1 MAG: hypothetical protein DRN14_02465 [Thermoplasmata archaeon]HDJ27060.1 DUF2240 family protein [Aciduliprofundum sp.]
MSVDLRAALAYVFRSRGPRLRESDIVNFLSAEKGWISPSNARKLISMALERGLLRRRGQYLEPTFDPSGVPVPLDFYLDNRMFEVEDPMEAALSLALGKGISREGLESEIRRITSENPLLDEVAAAILVLKRLGLDPTQVATLRLAQLGIKV